jgi:hypothetical protein
MQSLSLRLKRNSTHRGKRLFLFNTFRVYLAAALLLVGIGSCVSSFSYRAWSFADLRQLDPLDNTPTPSTDILAVYNRTIGSDLEIRIDLLDIPIDPDYDLRLYLSTPSGELTILVPAAGLPIVTPPEKGIKARVIRDPWLDTVTILLNRLVVSQPFTYHVAAFVRGAPSPSDVTLPVRSDALPPSGRARLLLAFWDTFPAFTPAQALRRWDGAHTGPRGERHGLRNLLDAVSRYNIPVALLDLKTPSSLAALNYLGVLSRIQSLAGRGLLILPDVAYAEPARFSLDFSRRAAVGFGLPSSLFVYDASSIIQPDYPEQFVIQDQTADISHNGDTRLIPVPPNNVDQATIDGLSLDARRRLIAAAFSTDPSRLVVLGGDLPNSTWGNENMAAPSIAWIAGHPWIHPLSADDLLALPFGKEMHLEHESDAALLVSASASPFLGKLQNAPTNPITLSAWQTYFMLAAPTGDQQLQALRASYFGQLGDLLAAAHWVQEPLEQANCSQDLNGDIIPDCILSTRKIMAIFNPRGGRLTELFTLDGAGPHQVIGPSSQFTVGLSDPSEWRMGQGEASDPSAILGAFSGGQDIWSIREPVGHTSLTFIGPDGTWEKTYLLTENGLSVSIRGTGPINATIPLVVDPQIFYFAPIQYQSAYAPDSLTWGQTDGTQVEITSDAAISAQSFTDSLPSLSFPENPDLDYLPGHYFAFPLSVVTIQGFDDVNIQLSVK